MTNDARITPHLALCCTVSSIIVPRSSVALSEVRSTAIFTTFGSFSSFVSIGTASIFRRTPHHFWRPTSQTSPKPENDNNYPSTGYIFEGPELQFFWGMQLPFSVTYWNKVIRHNCLLSRINYEEPQVKRIWSPHGFEMLTISVNGNIWRINGPSKGRVTQQFKCHVRVDIKFWKSELCFLIKG